MLRVQNLKKNLILLDHAEFAARAFLDCVEPLLEIAHFGVERGIAHLQLLIGFALRLQLLIDFPHAQPAALAKPQRILQQRDQAGQREGQINFMQARMITPRAIW